MDKKKLRESDGVFFMCRGFSVEQMDRAERLRHSRQQADLSKKNARLEQDSRQLGEMSRLVTASQNALLDVRRQVQLNFAALCEIKARADQEQGRLAELRNLVSAEQQRVADLEQRAQAANVKMRQIQAVELASQAALRSYTEQLEVVTNALA